MDSARGVDTSLSGDESYDLLPCGILRADKEQRIIYVNAALGKWLGYTREELIGKRRVPELFSIGGKILFNTHHFPRLELEGEVLEVQYDILAKNGCRVSVTLSIRKLPEPAEGYVYVFLPFNDRKKLEQDLRAAKEAAEAADRAKSVFLSTMSHEIRTPLHAIIEGGNFLLKENPRPDQTELIVALRVAGSNLLAVVNDILDISKLQSGQLTLNPQPFCLQNLLKSIKSTYQALCRKRKVGFEVNYRGGPPPLLIGDAAKIKQVLDNLVSNAVKFTAEGRVDVIVEHQLIAGNVDLTLSVEDTGPGIAPDRLKAIFEPFTQASSKTSGQFGGTGLGLAIAQRVVAAHESELIVKSTEGEGTRFFFTLNLPVAEEDVMPGDHGAPFRLVEELKPLTGFRVLNVDDNRSNLLINARYFSEWQLDYKQFTSPRKAMAALDTEDFDLALLDLRMPEIDGYEMARRIRTHSRPEVADMPMIALSASASSTVSPRMLEAGFSHLVPKPFDPVYLHHLIGQHCNRPFIRPTTNPAKEQTVNTVPQTSLDFSEVQSIFAGDHGEYLSFLRQIVSDMEEAKQEIDACKESFSPERFSQLKHNLLSTVRVFYLEDIGRYLTEGKDALLSGDRAAFTSVAEILTGHIEAFLAALGGQIDPE